MKLIGSNASPYARRIRILLLSFGIDFEFEPVNVLSEEGQKKVQEYSAALKIPILIDNNKVLFDSFLMTKYLLKKIAKKNLSLEEEKELVLLNEANDSGILLFQMKKFELDQNYENQFSLNQKKRLSSLLDIFNLKNPSTDIGKDWLYCLLDWLLFRDVFSWNENRENLTAFYDKYSKVEVIKLTDPRL